ncbi:LPS export ABC transporter periplasmic protein LptC [Lampropedia aestuarii]|uniref:LPS export ABC transporter periplasmic protein LptC n=1 Tax=Lampropedia aestuarii TaxID=2562762 RepID=A0A4S5BZ10_9BURK|nr:LPS export ABC transporter periplasmic protein LptC [Lampropedia aestuarii]MDH5859148.1 LPS export ABC transporter periplasmic protein LptC [Lampropedia aestuarii]THJ36561.1 LPS export ABC transporter periplasmic protein LptC [Lampropedia aestuarii]
MSQKPKRSLRYRLDRLSVYGPVLVMAALALGTYWLARSVPSAAQPSVEPIPVDEPDYTITEFATRSYDGTGRLTVELFGDTAKHYPAKDLLVVDRLRMRAVTEDGRIITATANSGTTNGDSSEVQLHGNAVVVQLATATSPRLEFRGEELQVWPDEERVVSDLPVELFRGADRMTGQTLVYDKKQQTTEIDGRVRSTIQPAARP